MKTPGTDLAKSQRLLGQETIFRVVSVMCAGLTGRAVESILKHHAWGPMGAPAWAAHSGRIAALVALGTLGCMVLQTAWEHWWGLNFLGMMRSRFRNWNRWCIGIGLGIGLAAAPFLPAWLHAHRVPHAITHVVCLGLLATTAVAMVPSYLRLQALTRIQRELLMQSQLAPHFLFNSLGALKNQIVEDPLEAQATADRLSRLFRDLMDLGNQTSVPLSRELAFVETYLGLEKARLGDRLTLHIDVPEELEELPVPPLSLQVLVENAVRHAIAPRLEGGVLSIEGRRSANGLLLKVTDPGDGTSLVQGTGRGLQVLRARLTHPSDLAFEQTPMGHTASLLVRPA